MLRSDSINKIKYYVVGFIAGIFNGFFGAGGGLIIVPILEKLKLEPKKAHATSIAIILPLSIISTVIYFYKGITFEPIRFSFFAISGFFGAIGGAYLLNRISNNILKRLFGAIMIISAVRIFLR